MTFSVSKILFDLDGTLVDTAPDLTRALNHALESAGFLSVGHNSVKDLVGYGALALIKEGLTLQNALDVIDPAELLPSFLTFYGDNIADYSTPYDGCLDLLDHLKAMDIALGICSNKPEKLAVSLLRELKMDHYFGAISGGDTFEHKKPDPRHLIYTASLLSGGDDILMVGDSLPDIEAAKAANLPSIGVTFGYSTKKMATLKPTKIVDSLSDIKPLINR